MEARLANMDPEELLKTMKNAPEKVLKAMPYLIGTLSQLITAKTMHDSASPINNVLYYMEPGRMCPTVVAQSLLDQANHNTGVASQNETLINIMTTNSGASKAVKQNILDGMKGTANKFLISSAVCAGIQAAFSFYSLWKLYQTVKDARNITEASKRTLAEISESFEFIETRMSKLDNIFKELNQQGIRELQIMLFSNKANRLIAEIDIRIRDSLSKMDSLEFEIRLTKVKLGDARRNTYIAGANSAVNCATSIFSIITLAAAGGPVALGVTGALAGLNLLLGVTCPVVAYLCGKDLEELSKMLDEVGIIKAKMKDLEMKHRTQADLLYDRIEKLATPFSVN